MNSLYIISPIAAFLLAYVLIPALRKNCAANWSGGQAKS